MKHCDFPMPSTLDEAVETIESLRERLAKTTSALAAVIVSFGEGPVGAGGVHGANLTVLAESFAALPPDYGVRLRRLSDFVVMEIVVRRDDTSANGESNQGGMQG